MSTAGVVRKDVPGAAPDDKRSGSEVVKKLALLPDAIEIAMGYPYHDLGVAPGLNYSCLLYTSDAADERSSVDLGGRRIIKKKNKKTKTNNNAV